MSDPPGRGYLPPTVPSPGAHRSQWPPTFNYFSSQWQGTRKQFMVASSSPPQSESMDLSSRAEVNGAELNGGTGVSVIAPNPLVAEERPGKLPTESARLFEPQCPPPEEKVPTHPTEGKSPPNLPAGSRTPPAEDVPRPQLPAEVPLPSSESAATPTEDKSVDPDHVESLLENMFQGEAKPSVIVTNCSRPVLTEDKVVEILQDKDTSITDIKVEPEEPKPIETKPEELMNPKEEPKENQFMEVESELEKMFAGIEEEKPAPLDTELVNQNKSKTKKTSKPRQRKSTDSVDAKKRKAKKERPRPKKTKREKDTSNDSSTISRNFRGPYVHIEGTKDIPSYISVVNSGGKEEEERERGDKRKHHTLIEGRAKGSNLYSSTLSTKYNSQNVDTTWVCVFCKQRAHCEGGFGGEPAGDLFGPYILTVPMTNDQDREVPSDRDVAAEQKKKGGGKAASLRAVGALDAFINNFSKKSKKTSLSNTDEISGDREVWVHEKCAIWAPGVYLAGPHLVGLAQAVAIASVTKCNVCGLSGACIGCVRRNCSGRVHFGCGLTNGWILDDHEYLSICQIHSVKKEKSKKTP